MAAEQLLEEYTEIPNNPSFYGALWCGQTFTPQLAATLTKVVLPLNRYGSPGTVTVSIRATSGGQPTGGDLVVGTFNGNTLPLLAGGVEWKEIPLSWPLTNGTKLAIVLRATGGTSVNYVRWYMDFNASTYPRGNYYYSNNSGGSWTYYATRDCGFKVYGIPVTPGGSGSPGLLVAQGVL